MGDPNHVALSGRSYPIVSFSKIGNPMVRASAPQPSGLGLNSPPGYKASRLVAFNACWWDYMSLAAYNSLPQFLEDKLLNFN